MERPYLLLNDPWEVRRAIDTEACSHKLTSNHDTPTRARFAITPQDSFIYTVGATDAFPSHEIRIDNKVYRITELPGPALSGDKAFKDTVEIRRENAPIEYINLNYRDRHHLDLKNFDFSSIDASELFDRVLDEMIFIVRNILKVEKVRAAPLFWRDVLDPLTNEYEQDPAKHALIVELAENIVPPLERITRSPKKGLMRIRDQERVQKVREIDKHCVVDLARRPGSSLPEKAGPKQRVLSIKRRENTNNLENQVVLHCCKMLSQSSKRYLFAHKEIENSRRKNAVDSLSRCCNRVAKVNSLENVKRLRSPCRQPNYVLLQNIHYSKVWKAYTQLLRDEMLRDQLWRWSRRLYSDYIAIYMADTILHWFESIDAPIAVHIGDKVVQAKNRPQYGKWLLSDILPGPLVLGVDDNSTGTFYAVDGRSCDFLGANARCLRLLNADYLLIWLTCDGCSVLPIYVNVVGDDEKPGNLLEKTATDLLREVASFNRHSVDLLCVGAWVFHDKGVISSCEDIDHRSRNHISCWQSSFKTDPVSWRKRTRDDFIPLNELTGF